MQIAVFVLTGAVITFASAHAQQEHALLSPLKQIESGIQSQDIQCKEGFVLLWKTENDSPACVKPSSTSRLMVQGWVTPEKFQIYHKKFLKSDGSVNASNINVNNSNSPIRIAQSHTPFPELSVTPTISPKPETIKILAIGMSPNPLRVNDVPGFTVTYQNISDKPIIHLEGCGSSLHYILYPESNVQEISQPMLGCAEYEASVQPSQVITDGAEAGQQASYYYKIIKPDTLNVNMTLSLEGENYHIQFQVNATQ